MHIAKWALLLTSVLASVVSGQEAEKSKPKTDSLTTIVKVIGPDGEPLNGSRCNSGAGNANGRIEVQITEQGPGVFKLVVPADTYYFRITVTADKHTPMISNWRWQPDDKKNLPAQIVFPMKRGATISGKVRDEQGNAISDATVRLLADSPAKRGTKPYSSLYDHAVKTDANGVWRCNLLPENMTGVWLRFEHPEFTSDEHFGQTSTDISVEQLRKGSLVSVLKKGKTVVGTVVDPDGVPVVGAKIYQGSDRFGSHYPETKTDQKGIFRFPNSRAGEMILTIYAKGFAPELLELNVAPNMRAARVKLKHGNPLLLKVVDGNGKPIAGALVAADTWRDHRTLCDLPIPRRTNAKGELVWKDAPADAIQYDILKAGFFDARNQPFTANGKQQVITLGDLLKISGKVTDAVSGEPITSFDVVGGISHANQGRISWQSGSGKSFKNGSYELTYSYPYPGRHLRFDAVGYVSGNSRKFVSNDGSVTFDIKLQPTKPLMGIVVNEKGAPVSEAVVAINLPDQYTQIKNGRIESRDMTYVTTDKDGKFQLPSMGDKAVLLAMHDSGMKMVTQSDFNQQKNGQKIKLVPWSTVNVSATDGDLPAKQHKVRMSFQSEHEARFNFSGVAITDDEGNATLNRVPPNQQVSVQLNSTRQQTVVLGSKNIDTLPGKTATVKLP